MEASKVFLTSMAVYETIENIDENEFFY